ncbi:DNA polymerase IV [Chloropicon roscoffensis]|uniref:DNA polymerase kappa n=2 Tax=Chloropicon roscoffensis TaxID=1461544 RepID=A0AAX4P399_9CHLO
MEARREEGGGGEDLPAPRPLSFFLGPREEEEAEGMAGPSGRAAVMAHRDEGRDWQIEEHDGSFRKYMEAKEAKLRVQFAKKRAAVAGAGEGGIFRGVVIHVNGYTTPSHSELKDLMAEHGGSFENYFSSARVTHVICANLTDAKLKQHQKEKNPVPVVHPNWVVESIRAGRLLPFAKYVLDRIRKEPGQSVLPVAPRPAAGGGTPKKRSRAEGGDLLNNVDSFFKNSRLHFIGSWKAKIEDVMAAAASLDPPKPDPPGAAPRRVVHVDIDCFFASVAVRENPSLEGKPVAVCHSESTKGTAEISSCSYEARKFGVRAGMRISDARDLCPSLVQAPYYFEKYQEISVVLYRTLLRSSARVQPVSIDEAYLDITGLGDPREICEDIRARFLGETGCTVSCGCSHNMLLAKIATSRAKPNGVFAISSDESEAFMADLAVREIPGVGWKSSRRLEEMGVATCGDLWRLSSKTALQKSFGAKQGELIWDYSRGIDSREVKSETKRHSVGAEINWGIRFEHREDAVRTLGKLAEEVERRLRRAGIRGRCITLKLKLRKPNAPPPPKFLGHGWCDNLSRSVTLASAADDAGLIAREAVALLLRLDADPREIRGLGIQITKLDEGQPAAADASEGRARSGGQPGILDTFMKAGRRAEAAGPSSSGGGGRGESVRLSDIDVNEQKYILSMIQVRQREQSKRKHFFEGFVGRERGAARWRGDAEGDPGPREPPREPSPEPGSALAAALGQARFSHEVAAVLAGAEAKDVVEWVLRSVESDLESIWRLLRAVRSLRGGGPEATAMGAEGLEEIEGLISKSVENVYKGTLPRDVCRGVGVECDDSHDKV